MIKCPDLLKFIKIEENFETSLNKIRILSIKKPRYKIKEDQNDTKRKKVFNKNTIA